MSEQLTPARYIREHIFEVATQWEFAAMLGYEQATISRFETGTCPFSSGAQRKIRDLAAKRGIDWDNNWFFDVPNSPRPCKVNRTRAA